MSERLVVRAPNHLGDLVMSLPALGAAGADAVVVPRGLAPLLPLGGVHVTAIPLVRRARGFWPAVTRVRRGRFTRGVLLTPSFSSALLFRLAGVARVRGTDTDGRGFLLREHVPMSVLRGRHRTDVYHVLITGREPDEPFDPVVRVPGELIERWRGLIGEPRGPVAGIFPGANASSRRWDAERFAELGRRLAADGARVVVFGGPGERELTRRVAGEWAFDAGGRTDLLLLAAGLAACHILITNDSGPMHLGAAVGTPVVVLQGAADPVATGLRGSRHITLRRADLPCVPCVKNECPRHGAGTFLAEAERECLRLIDVSEVVAAARTRMPS